MATPHGPWESTFLKRKFHLDLPRNAPISIFSKQVHPEWTHNTISSNMFPPISLIYLSMLSSLIHCSHAYIHYLGRRLDDNLPSILILKDVDQRINHGKQEYLKKLDRSGYRSSMEHCRMPLNNIEHPGTLWNMIEHGRTSWNIMEPSGNW